MKVFMYVIWTKLSRDLKHMHCVRNGLGSLGTDNHQIASTEDMIQLFCHSEHSMDLLEQNWSAN